MRKLLSGTIAALAIGLSSPAFADRTNNWPEGSIYMQPSTQPPARAAQPTTQPPAVAAQPAPQSAKPQSAKVSPLDPLDAPDAGNVWKPSNRDAGNLAAKRWQNYQDSKRAGAAGGQ
jgi:hypothetical protein